MDGISLRPFLMRSSRDFADYILEQFPEFHRSSRLHLSVVHHYLFHLHQTYDLTSFMSKSSATKVDNSFVQVLKNVILSTFMPKSSATEAFVQEIKNVIFVVPRVTKFAESQYRIKKYQLLEVFISFLLQLLYHKTDSITMLWKERIEDIEKELRFLHTILGDTSLMTCADKHQEFHNLFVEFEVVANKAGSLAYLVFLSTDQAFGEIDKGLDIVLDHVGLLKISIMKFLNRVSSTGILAYMTPRTSVVDSLLFVGSLIHYLEDLVNRDQSNLIADVKDQINTLHQELISFRSSIKETGPQQPSEIGELKETLMRIGDLVSGGEHLIVAFLVGDAPLWYLINRLSDINHVMELTRINLQEITRRQKFGGLETVSNFSAQLSLQDCKRYSEGNETDTAIGLEDEATDILQHLIGGAKHLQLISICGMPGVGKTTLAKKLYNHPSVNYRFDKLSWCVVSQEYQRQSVLTDILTQLMGNNSTLEMDEASLAERVYKTLKGRRYFIVMDDIWDAHVWDGLRSCFPDDCNESRILFTTREKDVAPLDTKIFALRPLSNDQCWELLLKKVFHNNPCPPELLGIGKEISANCHGLPLTVVVIAGVLSTVDKKRSIWEEVGGNLASYIFKGGENSVLNILELSYKHLPDHLKPCFLYFGAFQKDREILVSELTRLWVAEGFIHEEGRKSAEDVAEEYLINLIDKSLVIVAETRSDGGVKACVVHDLVHDLCLRKCEEENFLNIVKKNDCYSIYRLHYLDRPFIYCQHLRSFRGHFLGSNSESFYVRDLRLLRVLHSDYILNDYIGIEYLLSLRYLVVSDLPPSIGSLVNLEYLRVEASGMVILTPEVRKMMKLRYIHAYNPRTYTYATYGGDGGVPVSQTNNLEFVSGVVISNLKDEEMLKCSPHLLKLKCIFEEASVSMIEATRDVDFSFFTQLVSLNVNFIRGVMMEKMNFPSCIRKLTLSGLSIQSWEEMSRIGRLENLEVLKLRQVLCATEIGGRWDTRDGEFQKLRFLEINYTDLCQWNVASSLHFPRLQHLALRHCFRMEEIPSEIGEIATLQLIEVKSWCSQSVVESARRIQQEQWDMGNDDLRFFVSSY